MRHRSGWTALAIAALVLSVIGTSPADARARRESNAEVILISFGATNGELKDCGCHSIPMGGLPHRAGFIDSLRIRQKIHLLVDLGDFMSTEAAVAELKNRFIWRSMEEMGYCATTPGVREISDWRRYRDLIQGSPVRSIATNLTVGEGGSESAAGLPYLVREINGVRVAFFSLIGAREIASASPPPGLLFRAEDPLTVASRIVPKLHKQADVVVLMSQMSADQTDRLLAEVPGIDVALYGREPKWVDVARTVSQTIVQQTGNRGAQLGELVLIVDPAGRIVEWGSRNDALGPSYGEDLEVAAQVEQVENKAKEMITADQQRRAAGANAPGEAPAVSEPRPSDPIRPVGGD
jgi:2',3'-cyclic-nucleotide 2'-phosphodiesterase (5'-nucleotidase family)